MAILLEISLAFCRCSARFSFDSLLVMLSATPPAFCCSMYSFMKSIFSSSWSLGMPISTSSSKIFGSISPKADCFSDLGLGGAKLTFSLGGMMDWGNGIGTWGAEDDRWPCNKLPIPPNRLCDFPFWSDPRDVSRAGPEPWNGVDRVLLLAFFSRSSIFFLNCFASFSSVKERPAKQSSSSKEWKNVLS